MKKVYHLARPKTSVIPVSLFLCLLPRLAVGKTTDTMTFYTEQYIVSSAVLVLEKQI